MTREIVDLYQQAARAPQPVAQDGDPVSDSMLLLSGGSQDGAFGAGFLQGWGGDSGRGIPRARIVTGISTGAILSTFAFLREPGIPYREYQIAREGDILHAYAGARSGGLARGFTAATRGAIADLSPLRRLLLRNITDRRLMRLADEYDAGRRLFIGAVDIDHGRMVAFDMTALADTYRANPGRREQLRHCYVDIIIASSSVPLAAPPSFIDNRMYIDGGARFGLFTYEFEQIIRQLSERGVVSRGAAGGYPYLYAIVNGDLAVERLCRTAPDDEDNPCPDADEYRGAHRSWSLDGLAARSVSILIDQVYRFSAARLRDIGDRHGFTVDVEYIEPAMWEFRYTMPPESGHLGEGENTCRQWRRMDRTRDRPVEFHPRFMHCLVEYGRQRGIASGWADHVQHDAANAR